MKKYDFDNIEQQSTSFQDNNKENQILIKNFQTMNNLVGDAERLIKLNKVTEGVRCITTAAALVALVQNEKQAMYLLDSVVPLPAFKEHELMIRNEFKEGESF